jgi:hypothetical protein
MYDEILNRIRKRREALYGDLEGCRERIMLDDITTLLFLLGEANAKLAALASSDPVIVSMERLVEEYGDDGPFKIDEKMVPGTELLADLKSGGAVGNGFRGKVYELMLHYFMRFGGKEE